VALQIDAGYAFNRSYFESDNYSGSHDNELNLDSAPYAGAKLRISL